MSAQPSPSPQPGLSPESDEAKLPSGHCRFILLNPEIKGHRCACAGFTLNRALPSVTCECGHFSCYHARSAEPPGDKLQLEQLLRRIRGVEEQLDRENEGGLGSALRDVVKRLGDLEEQYERTREEFGVENRGIYRQINNTWSSVDQIGKSMVQVESRLVHQDERISTHNESIEKLGNRIMEHEDAAMLLEDRLDRIEDAGGLLRPARRSSLSAASASGNSAADSIDVSLRPDPISTGTTSKRSTTVVKGLASRAQTIDGTSLRRSSPWTVHVSLMPMASVAFPFEKDTNAYKRCLSRGLHQMIAVQGADSDSFVAAISKAFGSLLQDRPWMPLQARLCEAETLLGLPMLRPLDSSMIANENYDMDFLRRHCAVCGPNGKLDSLYIAMQSDAFSWHFLSRSPCYLQGLEDSWAYDPLLDHNDPFEDDSMDEGDRPSAGNILPPIQSLKRTASERSRTPSFNSGSAGDCEGSRPKVARTGACVAVPLELRRRVETV